MGCFASKDASSKVGGKSHTGAADESKQILIARVFQPKSTIRGIRYHPSAAALAASKKLQSANRVVVGKDHIFACLFEGYGGNETCDFLHRSAYASYCTALKRCEGDVAAALPSMLQELDLTLLQAAKASPAKAATGAGAVIAVIDIKGSQLHAATVGGCVCLIARAVGSFNQALTEADIVADGRKARAKVHGLRMMQKPAGPELEAGRGHILGFGIVKSQTAADAYAQVSGTEAVQVLERCPPLHCEVGSRALLPGDGHVLLLSSGMLDLLPATTVAIMAQQFSTREMQTLLDASTGIAEDSEDVAAAVHRPSADGTDLDVESPLELTIGVQRFNVSELLARYAASRLEEANAAKLKLKGVKIPEVGAAALPASGALLHSDAALVSIAIDFPRSMTSRQLKTQRAVEVSKARKSPIAAYRWHLLRQYLRFEHLRRISLRQAWDDVVAGLIAQADQNARTAEKLAWQHMNEAVQVTRAGLVMRPGSKRPGTSAATPASGGKMLRHRGGTPHNVRRINCNQSPSRHCDIKARPPATPPGPVSSFSGARQSPGSLATEQYSNKDSPGDASQHTVAGCSGQGTSASQQPYTADSSHGQQPPVIAVATDSGESHRTDDGQAPTASKAPLADGDVRVRLAPEGQRAVLNFGGHSGGGYGASSFKPPVEATEERSSPAEGPAKDASLPYTAGCVPLSHGDGHIISNKAASAMACYTAAPEARSVDHDEGALVRDVPSMVAIWENRGSQPESRKSTVSEGGVLAEALSEQQ